MRNTPLWSGGIALALLSVPLVAQINGTTTTNNRLVRTKSDLLVVPSGMAREEGAGSTRSPFGLSTAARSMCVYNKEELGFGGPIMFSGMRLRADNDGKTLRGKSIIVANLSLSTSTVTAETATTTFDDNHGSDRTEVMPFSHLAFPWQAANQKGPRPFNISLPFQAPFFFHFQATPVRGRKVPKSLVLDMQVKQQPNVFYRLDTPLGCLSNHTVYGKAGALCLNGVGKPLKLHKPGPLLAGGVASYLITDANPNQKLFLVLGVGMPGPNNTPLSLSGGTAGCYLNTTPLLTQIGKANARGQGGFKVKLPVSQKIVGLSFQAQAGAEDRRANAIFLITSLGVRSDICGPRGVARIYHDSDMSAAKGDKVYGSSFIFEMLQ